MASRLYYALRVLRCLALLVVATSVARADKPDDFVEVAPLVPDAVIDLRYATEHNFTRQEALSGGPLQAAPRRRREAGQGREGVARARSPARDRDKALEGDHGGEARRLDRAMRDAGFIGMPTEWWHFDDADASTYPLADDPL